MTLSGVEVIGFSFIVKLFASWTLITMAITGVITFLQERTHGRGTSTTHRGSWQQRRQDRRAAIIRSYPEVVGE